MKRIKVGDNVKVIAGGAKVKGKDGKVVKVAGDKVFIEKVNLRERHIHPTQLNPQGSRKDIHVGVHVSNVVLINNDKSVKVGYRFNEKGEKFRADKKTGKEIK